MRTSKLSFSRNRMPAWAFMLAVALAFLPSATAQNLLKNPGFESALDPWDPSGLTGGKGNWTVVYATGSGGPGDFAIKDRTQVSKHSGSLGGHLRPATEWWCHAYFKQVVTNLTAGASYVVSGWIRMDFFDNGKDHVYIEALGGPSGNTSTVSPDVADVGTEGDWAQYSVTNTASNAGTIEVRLHSSKQSTPLKLPGLAMYYLFDAYFDDFSVTLQ